MHLISASSSDREFPSVIFRKQRPASHNPHENITVKNIHLVNGGFPVNFDGSDRSLPTQQAQLIVALMLGSIYEASQTVSAPGLMDLNLDLQKKVVDEYQNICQKSI